MPASYPKIPLPVILGQTASGKSSTAIYTAQLLGAEIVMADSMAVYKYMDIGTAKPTHAEQKQVAHHGINLIGPDQTFSTADWTVNAQTAISNIYKQQKIPLLVCGTGLYLKSLEDGLSKLPKGDDKLRGELENIAAVQGPKALHEKLTAADPEKAAQIHPNNVKRVIRALEICMLGDKTPTNVSAEHSYECPYRLIKFGLRRQKPDLHARINKRVDLMLEQGLVDEVRTLVKNPGLALTAQQAIGYKQMIEFLEGKTPLEQVAEKIKLATRQYAKRQMTWFKKVRNVNWIELEPDTNPHNTADIIYKHITDWLSENPAGF